MEVAGSRYVGIMDHLGGDRIKLTHHDSQARGQHHFLPLSAAMSIGEFVTLPLTVDEAESQWQIE